MVNENLASNISFILDAIIKSEIDEANIETLSAALILSHFSWNNEVREGSIKANYYQAKLKKLEKANPDFWGQLILGNSEELIDVLRKRKMVFFPDDKRLIKSCFINVLGTVSVKEDNDDKTLHVEPR